MIKKDTKTTRLQDYKTMCQCQSSEFRVQSQSQSSESVSVSESESVSESVSESESEFRVRVQSSESEFRVQSLEFRVQSHVVTTEYRQAVKCEARNPCIHDQNDIKSAEGTTEVFFCRTFSALICFKPFLAGIPHCVLHHLPRNCCP